MITSTKSSKVKYIVRLQQKARFRQQEGLFVCEGKRLVMEVPQTLRREVFATREFLSDEQNAAWLDGVAVETVSSEVMAKMTGTVHPQGVMAVVRQPEWTAEDIFGDIPLVVFLENIQDPGNLGTIVRAAEAAGATGIVASAGTADVFSPKVVRSTMGSVFRLPYIEAVDFEDTLRRNRERGIRLFAAVLDSESRAYDAADLTAPAGLVIGNEGAGLSKAAVAACDEKIYIPMQGAESLNASVATGVLLFEAARQRRYADMV